MKSFLTQKVAFDKNKIFPGRAMVLVQPPHNLGDNPRERHVLVKEVLPDKIILLVGESDVSDNRWKFHYEEKTYPVESFEGNGAYDLIPMVKAEQNNEED